MEVRLRKTDKVEWDLGENMYGHGYVRGWHVFTLDRERGKYAIRARHDLLTVTGRFATPERAFAAAQKKFSEAGAGIRLRVAESPYAGQ